MKYNDGVTMDTNERITKCPTCGNTEFSSYADYCKICGNTRRNLCTNEFVDERHANPGNARYCEICGKETTFFVNGLLKPWNEVTSDDKIEYTDEELPF